MPNLYLVTKDPRSIRDRDRALDKRSWEQERRVVVVCRDMEFELIWASVGSIELKNTRTGQYWHFMIVQRDGRRGLLDDLLNGSIENGLRVPDMEDVAAYDAAMNIAGERELIDVTEGE